MWAVITGTYPQTPRRCAVAVEAGRRADAGYVDSVCKSAVLADCQYANIVCTLVMTIGDSYDCHHLHLDITMTVMSRAL